MAGREWQAGYLVKPCNGGAACRGLNRRYRFFCGARVCTNCWGAQHYDRSLLQSGQRNCRALYDALFAHREEFIELSIANGGNTRNDAKFDIDGATATLLAYVDVGKELGDRHIINDGDSTQIGRTPRYAGRHIYSTMQGVAVHVNAFQFSCMGIDRESGSCVACGNASRQ